MSQVPQSRFEGAYMLERSITHIVSLSAGALILSATLVQTFGEGLSYRWAIVLSWSFFILTIMAGLSRNYYSGMQLHRVLTFEVWRHNALEGRPMTHEDHDRLVTDTVGQDLDKYARRSARLDVATRVLFFVALLLLGLFAAINIY